MAQFGHMVFFTLRDKSDAAIEALLAGCQAYLSGHEGTVYFSAGQLADTTRDVNDREFDVSLHLIFEDRAAHDAYQVAPRHDEFISKLSSNWANVRVFDSVI